MATTSDRREPRGLQWRLTACIAGLEMRYHAREFLTWVYVAVFFFLTFGYVSSDAVTLVRDRGAVPKTAPWAVAHAMAGVTAFGQVITTMIAATAVLRDVGARTQELFFTTRARAPAYLGGRFLGALVVMGLVYLAIPVGLVGGDVVAGLRGGGDVVSLAAGAVLRPLTLLVVPNVIVVATLFFAAGAMGGSFMAILLLGVALVALWQTGLSLEAAAPGTWLGALVDPFGNAALAAETAGWTDAARATRPIPLDGVLLANRAAWLTVAAAAAALVFARYRMRRSEGSGGSATGGVASSSGTPS